MRRLIPLGILIPLLFLLPACAPPGGTPPPPTRTPLPSPFPSATLPPPIPPTAAPAPPRTTYQIDALLDYAAHILTARQTLTYLNDTPDTLTELILVVEPARLPGVFALDDLRWSQSGAPAAGWSLADGALTVPFVEPLPPGGHISLELAFTLALPAQPGKLGYADGQLNLVDWYPFVPAYRGGFLVHPPSPVGETISYDPADYAVTFEVQNQPPGLVVAAGMPVSFQGSLYRFGGSGFRNFGLSLNEAVVVLEERVGEVLVTSVVPVNLEEAGRAALAAVVDALAVYGEMFGAYGHASLMVVAGNFPDGLEYDGLVFVGEEWYRDYDGGPQNYLTLLAAHETAHQWWYAQVGNDQALEPWLDEALATYSELLWLERARPDLAAWWWAFRVAAFAPEGAVGGTVYDFDGFRPYVNAVYLRGALMLHDLRAAVGDDVFRFALRVYAEQFAGREATAGDLIGVLEDLSGEELTALLQGFGVPE
jgi:hypothetical protein